MILIYCKTYDSQRDVADLICRANCNSENSKWILGDECEGDCWVIQTNCKASPDILVYRICDSVVATEVDDDCASKVAEPLIASYGFENVKWLITK